MGFVTYRILRFQIDVRNFNHENDRFPEKDNVSMSI